MNEDWWFRDSGASHHVTNEFENMSIGSEYSGAGKVHLGNGTGLDIAHIGHSKFKSPSSCRIFLLKNILHVPLITKNILSVNKFAQENHVFFEFHLSFVFSSPPTRVVLLKGSCMKASTNLILDYHVLLQV